MSGTLRVAQGTRSEPHRAAGGWLLPLAWFALLYNVLVILWGAVVRITGAGAGCGDHWPLCNGVVVPPSLAEKTLIEFSHRLTSGASGVVAIALFAAAFAAVMRRAPATGAPQGRVRLWFGLGLAAAGVLLAGAALHSGALVLLGAGLGLGCLVGWLSALLATRGLTWREAFTRWPVLLGAALSFALILLEGVVGGIQVLLGLTADSADPARGFVQGIHLANTFALLGALLLTVLWARGEPALRLRGQGRVGAVIAGGVVLMLLLGMAGAVTALGDLLFAPAAGTPLDTVRRDYAATASLIENLRVVHPVLAILGSAYLLWMARLLARLRPSPAVTRWGAALAGVIGVQVLVGFVNVALKAPGWMQLVHLLLACIMWLVTLMLAYRALTLVRADAPAARGSA